MSTVVLLDSDKHRREQLALALTSVGGFRVDEYACASEVIIATQADDAPVALIIEVGQAEKLTEIGCSLPILAFSDSPRTSVKEIPVVRLSMNAIPSFATEVVRFVAKTT